MGKKLYATTAIVTKIMLGRVMTAYDVIQALSEYDKESIDSALREICRSPLCRVDITNGRKGTKKYYLRRVDHRFFQRYERLGEHCKNPQRPLKKCRVGFTEDELKIIALMNDFNSMLKIARENLAN